MSIVNVTKLTSRALTLCPSKWRRADTQNIRFVIFSQKKFDFIDFFSTIFYYILESLDSFFSGRPDFPFPVGGRYIPSTFSWNSLVMRLYIEASPKHLSSSIKVGVIILFQFFSCQLPENGNYTFYVACDDACTLWLHMNQNINQLTGKETENVFLARTLSSTGHNQWDR